MNCDMEKGHSSGFGAPIMCNPNPTLYQIRKNVLRVSGSWLVARGSGLGKASECWIPARLQGPKRLLCCSGPTFSLQEISHQPVMAHACLRHNVRANGPKSTDSARVMGPGVKTWRCLCGGRTNMCMGGLRGARHPHPRLLHTCHV